MKRKFARFLKYGIFVSAFIIFLPAFQKILSVLEKAATPLNDLAHVPRSPDENTKHNDFKDAENGNLKFVAQEKQESSGPIEDENGMIDWHNHQQIAMESKRKGPGEQGVPYHVPPEQKAEMESLFKVNGYNGLASDHISLHRALSDLRHPLCKTKKYLKKLLKASVIVPFHNEHFSTLMRLVHSIVNRSPPELLHEIVLADDFSTKTSLKADLNDYLKKEFTNVKVVRATKREGLIRARLLGAKAATGDVLIFLDAHCEATTNWLPPLLDPITRNIKTVVCPFIDVINHDTFAYSIQDNGARGAFDWEFFYKRLPLLPEDLKHPAEPFKSPVMAGGLFAISRQWFWDLGGYDPGLDIWGGEQYELSFKIWQCGGEMVDAPCSRVGHVYRKYAPFPNPGIGDFVGRNYRRVAMVWMDEYAEYLYKRRPHYRDIDPGNIDAQLAIRVKHDCKSFDWFIKNVAFDLVKMYPPVEPTPIAEGEIRNVGSNLCIDTQFKGNQQQFGVSKCIKDGGRGGEQYFELTFHYDIRPKSRSLCFDVSQSVRKSPVILFNCHGLKGNQWFKYNRETSQLLHPVSNQCLDTDIERTDTFMDPCDANSKTQRWKIEKINDVKLIDENWKIKLGEE